MKYQVLSAVAVLLSQTAAVNAGGYVAPVVPVEVAPISYPQAKKPFNWTGPYVGVQLGKTSLKINRKATTEHDAVYRDHDAVTRDITIPAETREVTTTTITKDVTKVIEHAPETESILVPAVIVEEEKTITVPGGKIKVPVYKVHEATYKTETITDMTNVGKITANKSAELPEGYALDLYSGDQGDGYYYVKKSDGGEYLWGEAGDNQRLSKNHATHTIVTTNTVTTVDKEARVEKTTKIEDVPGGTYTYKVPVIKEPARIETKTVKEGWTETVLLERGSTVTETETVVVTPETTETITVVPAWRELVSAAYTSTFVQELKDSANTYGAFGGYRYQFKNNVVVGAELNYWKGSDINATFDNVNYNFDMNTVSIEGQIGYAYKKLLPYVAVGYASTDGDGAWLAAVGADYALTDDWFIGAKYTHYKYDNLRDWDADANIVSMRVGYKF